MKSNNLKTCFSLRFSGNLEFQVAGKGRAMISQGE
jgi:hypothetical protein